MRTIKKVGLLVVLIATLVGCNKEKDGVDTEIKTDDFVYDMYDGEKVVVSINKESGYKYAINDQYFYVLEDGQEEPVLDGEFIGAGTYPMYAGLVGDESEVESTLIDSGETDEGNEYIFWEYDGQDFVQYNYAILIGETDHAVIMGSFISKEAAEDVFSNISFKLVDTEDSVEASDENKDNE